MVHCCVPGCTNYSSKTKNVSYHKIPTDAARKRVWIAGLRRANLPTLGNCYVCSDHFDEECFEVDLRQQLTGQKVKRRLKTDAVPSRFNFSTSIPDRRARASSENRTKRRSRHEFVDELLSVSYSNDETSPQNMEVDAGSGCQSVEVQDGSDQVESTTRDFGTQYCFETNYSITRTVGTQTEMFTNTSDASVQVNDDSSADQLKYVMHDHSYAMVPPTEDKSSVQPTEEKPSVPLPDGLSDDNSHIDECKHDADDDGSDDGQDDDDRWVHTRTLSLT